MQLTIKKSYPETFNIWKYFLSEKRKQILRVKNEDDRKQILVKQKDLKINTFIYKGYEGKEVNNFQNIFDLLKYELHFIDRSNNINDFKGIFGVEKFRNKIIWIAKPIKLIYFIYLLEKTGKITGHYSKKIGDCFTFAHREEKKTKNISDTFQSLKNQIKNDDIGQATKDEFEQIRRILSQ